MTRRQTRLQSLGKSGHLSPYCRALMLRSVMVPTGEKPQGVGVSQKLAMANPSPPTCTRAVPDKEDDGGGPARLSLGTWSVLAAPPLL